MEGLRGLLFLLFAGCLSLSFDSRASRMHAPLAFPLASSQSSACLLNLPVLGISVLRASLK